MLNTSKKIDKHVLNFRFGDLKSTVILEDNRVVEGMLKFDGFHLDLTLMTDPNGFIRQMEEICRSVVEIQEKPTDEKG